MAEPNPRPAVGVLAGVCRAAPTPSFPTDAGDLDRFVAALRSELVQPLVSAAGEACEAAGASRAARRGMGCVLGTLYGTGLTSEYIARTLQDRGPRWLSPEAFIYHSPHALAAEACIALGMGGPAVTVVGPTAGIDAVALAAGLVAAGSCEMALAGAFEWPTALAKAAFGAAGIELRAWVASSALLVLGREGLAAPWCQVAGWASSPGWLGPPPPLSQVMTLALQRSGLAPCQVRQAVQTLPAPCQPLPPELGAVLRTVAEREFGPAVAGPAAVVHLRDELAALSAQEALLVLSAPDRGPVSALALRGAPA